MKKNILIVDDSALMRRVISDIINKDTRFQVSDMAVNGLEALDLLIKNYRKYDAVILDINMPKMNGLELLEQINKHNIKTTVIVVSTVAKKGAKETIIALELGAFDFVTKPDSFIEAKSDSFQQQIINILVVATKLDFITSRPVIQPVIKSRSEVGGPQSLKTQESVPSKSETIKRKPGRKGLKLVALACSTGGPKALQSVIPLLPANLDAAFVIVQHMPEGFTNSLAMRLNEMSAVKVKEAENGDVLKNGIVYVAKGGSQMRVKKGRLEDYSLSVQVEAPRGGLKPCADIMYESLVSSNYEEITCVILTGMGGDGTSGIKQLNEENNIYVIAQNAETSTVYGMPKVIAESGLTDEVLPLDKIAAAITKHVGVR